MAGQAASKRPLAKRSPHPHARVVSVTQTINMPVKKKFPQVTGEMCIETM